MNDFYYIYKLTNTETNKIYIGFSQNPYFRFIQHKSAARRNNQSYLSKSIRKYGEDKFTLDILYMSKDRLHTLNVIEPLLIKEYNSLEPVGYNTRSGGECGSSHSESVRTKISISKTGKKTGPQTKEWIEKRTKNRKPPKPQTDEHRRKNSEANSGIKNGFYGKKHSAQVKSLMSEKAKMRPKIKCVCGVESSPSNFKRWHSNCV